MTESRRILIGVTSDLSLSLMRGFPRYLRSRGWEVHVACDPGPLLDELRRERGITTHPLRMAREPSPIADLRSLLAWVRLLRRVRPHVVSVGTPKAGLLGGFAARLTRVPFRVYHLRGMRLETTTGMRRRILTALERTAMSSAHVVIAVSPSLRQRALDLRLVPESRIRVLGHGSSNGVEVPPRVPSAEERAAKRIELGLDEESPVVGFVGRLTPDKGLEVLASAREILESRGVDHQMLIVGGVDEQAGPEVLHSIRSAGRSTIETGYVPDARSYYSAMDILCLPTFREGFPNVVLEASAVGIPTVTTDATGAVDSVVDGVTGLIAAVGDPKSLADRLQELIEMEPIARARIGAAARDRVVRDFSREHVWTLFQDFLAGGPHPVTAQDAR
jgi:glycosyltransferase involved in cell wall biosynthesis